MLGLTATRFHQFPGVLSPADVDVGQPVSPSSAHSIFEVPRLWADDWSVVSFSVPRTSLLDIGSRNLYLSRAPDFCHFPLPRSPERRRTSFVSRIAKMKPGLCRTWVPGSENKGFCTRRRSPCGKQTPGYISMLRRTPISMYLLYVSFCCPVWGPLHGDYVLGKFGFW